MWSLAVATLTAMVVLVRWRRSQRLFLDFVILGVTRGYTHLWHRWSSNGPAPLPVTGPAILVANHTCSADATFLTAGSPRLISFAASREHFNLHPLARRLLDYLRCVPVTRNSRDAVAARMLVRRLAEGCAVCIFPEGNLSGVARNRVPAGKHGAAFLALVSEAPVFPAYIAGGPRTDQLLESWVWPSRRAVRVIYGLPVDLSAYYGRPRTRRLLEEVTGLLQQRILELQPEGERKRLTALSQPRRMS
jgi:1-acyl-sn-glycerol-3-phosphate acyltransferase